MPRYTPRQRYLKDFGDEILPLVTPDTGKSGNNNYQKPAVDTELTDSSSPGEPVSTQKPGAYPAIPVQEYRGGPIEEIAVHYVRLNRIEENKATRKWQQEENIRSTELDFMLDLETLVKETAANPDSFEIQRKSNE